MGPAVVGEEGEAALRADHPHAVADRQLPQQRGERAALDESDVELVALVEVTAGGEATEYGRWTIRPSTITPIVMYWPASNGVGSPSKRTQKLASDSVMSSRRTRWAL